MKCHSRQIPLLLALAGLTMAIAPQGAFAKGPADEEGAAKKAAARKKAAPKGTGKKAGPEKQSSPEERFRLIQEAAYLKA